MADKYDQFGNPIPDAAVILAGPAIADGSMPYNPFVPVNMPMMELGTVKGAEVLPLFQNNPYMTLGCRGSRVTFTISQPGGPNTPLIIEPVTLTAFRNGRGNDVGSTGSPLPEVTGADADMNNDSLVDGDNILFKASGLAVQPQRPYTFDEDTGRKAYPEWLQHYSQKILDSLLVEAFIQYRWGSGTCDQDGDCLSTYPFWGGPSYSETTMNGAAIGPANTMPNSAWIYSGGQNQSDRLAVDVRLETGLEFPNDPAVNAQGPAFVSVKLFLCGYTICRSIPQNGCAIPEVVMLRRQLDAQNAMLQQLAQRAGLQLPNGAK